MNTSSISFIRNKSGYEVMTSAQFDSWREWRVDAAAAAAYLLLISFHHTARPLAR